jgi:hypothetical protein
MYFCVEYNLVRGVESKTYGCIACSCKALHVKPYGLLSCCIRKCHREAHGRLVGQDFLYGVCNPTILVLIHYTSTLKKEAVGFYEALVPIYTSSHPSSP